MSASTDAEIVKGCLDPKNYGFGKQTFVAVAALVAVTATVACVAARRVMDAVL